MIDLETEREEAIQDAVCCVNFYEKRILSPPASLSTAWDLEYAKIFLAEVEARQEMTDACWKAQKNFAELSEICRYRLGPAGYKVIADLAKLRLDLQDMKKDICDRADDTLWISGSETVVDRIDSILGDSYFERNEREK